MVSQHICVSNRKGTLSDAIIPWIQLLRDATLCSNCNCTTLSHYLSSHRCSLSSPLTLSHFHFNFKNNLLKLYLWILSCFLFNYSSMFLLWTSFKSRMVRNEMTYFYWTTRRDTIDNRILRKEQMTNHFARAGTFTTKVRGRSQFRKIPPLMFYVFHVSPNHSFRLLPFPFSLTFPPLSRFSPPITSRFPSPSLYSLLPCSLPRSSPCSRWGCAWICGACSGTLRQILTPSFRAATG